MITTCIIQIETVVAISIGPRRWFFAWIDTAEIFLTPRFDRLDSVFAFSKPPPHNCTLLEQRSHQGLKTTSEKTAKCALTAEVRCSRN